MRTRTRTRTVSWGDCTGRLQWQPPGDGLGARLNALVGCHRQAGGQAPRLRCTSTCCDQVPTMQSLQSLLPQQALHPTAGLAPHSRPCTPQQALHPTAGLAPHSRCCAAGMHSVWRSLGAYPAGHGEELHAPHRGESCGGGVAVVLLLPAPGHDHLCAARGRCGCKAWHRCAGGGERARQGMDTPQGLIMSRDGHI
jgi:hypothetical protein